jgi:hypothetical protein
MKMGKDWRHHKNWSTEEQLDASKLNMQGRCCDVTDHDRGMCMGMGMGGQCFT